MILACAWATFFSLYHSASEQPWYRIAAVMSFTEEPPYQHRVLLALLANGIQALTGWRPIRCLLISQVPVILLLFWMMMAWSRLFVGRRLGVMGPALACLMLVPTFHYLTFYDMATGFFFTAGLFALMRGRWWLFVLSVALGTFNHELILLLIPVAGLLWWRRITRWEWLWRLAVPLALHVGGRAMLFAVLPAQVAWRSGKLDFNLELASANPLALATSVLTLLPWWLLGAFGWRAAPLPLRQTTILLPLLFGIVIMVGQLNESRLFIPFMPIVVAFMLCALADGKEASPAAP